MKRVAVFVEGWTEFFFVARLIEEMAGFGRVHLRMEHQHGGTPHLYRRAGAPEEAADIEVLLMNCCGDGKVKSYILERKQLLINMGYSFVIGLQDLFPKPFVDWERFEAGLNQGLGGDPRVKIVMALQVMEAEAWFLNESKHYKKIDPRLTIPHVKALAGFDPVSDPAETKIAHPAKLLDKIYKSVGLGYAKKESEVRRTVDALDYEELFVTVRAMSKSLSGFLFQLETAGIC